MYKKFKIWDNQNKKFVGDSAPSLHCFSRWAVDIDGNIIELIVDISTGAVSVEENPDWYLDGMKVVKSKRYELKSFTGLFDSDNVEIHENDTLEVSYTGFESWIDKVYFKNGSFKIGSWELSKLLGDINDEKQKVKVTKD